MASDVDEADRNTRRPISDPNPPDLIGWPTKRLIALDALAPGLLARVLSAAPMSRHAIFAALSVRFDPRADDSDFALVLRSGKAREIVSYCRSEPPEGLLGAFARMGGQPLPRATYYDLLFDIFSDPDKRLQARALRHCGYISKLTLDALTSLESKWLLPGVLKRADNLMEVRDFQKSIDVLRSLPNPPTDETIERAILALGPKSKLSAVIVRLIRRAKSFPDHPLARDEVFQPLVSASDLIRASRKYENCLRHRIMGPLTGRVAYAEYKDGVAVIELRRMSEDQGWLLVGIHGPRNEPVTVEIRREIREVCSGRGIPHIVENIEDVKWRSLLRMADSGGLYDWAV